jgi:prepilin-type N-terminal cleavage/methylation domain-containing protein
MKNKGFSLIEIILVITLIAILAGIGIPRIINYADKAKEAILKTNLGLLRSAIENYYMENAIVGLTPFVDGHQPENPLNKSSKICYMFDTVGRVYVAPNSSACYNMPAVPVNTEEYGWIVLVTNVKLKPEIYANSEFVFEDGKEAMKM